MAEIVINKKMRFGKPTVKGTRITVDEIVGALGSGMSFEDVRREYGVDRDGILAALKYAAKVLSQEYVGSLMVSR